MRTLLWFVALAATLPAIGCAPVEKTPSYADLVVIYNAEAETLERLERRRAERVAEYEATLRPAGDEAIEALAGVLGGLGDSAAAERKLDATDPNELLDQAIANSENLGDQTEALLEAAAQRSGTLPVDRAAMEAMYSDEFKAQLAELDVEINQQRNRVTKARAARDAAEAE